MSFYLGNDTSGNAMMSISNTSLSKDVLKNNPYATGVFFNSKLEYLKVRKWGISTYTENVVYRSGGWTFTLPAEITFSTEFLSYVNMSGNPAFFIVVAGNLHIGTSNMASFMGWGSQFPCYNVSNFFDVDSYPSAAKPTTIGVKLSDVEKAAFPVYTDAYAVYTTNLTDLGLIESIYGSSILIDRTQFAIGNVNLYDYGYISTARHNDSDIKLQNYYLGLSSYEFFTYNRIFTTNAYIIENYNNTRNLSITTDGIYATDFKLFYKDISTANLQFNGVYSKSLGHINTGADILVCDEIFTPGDLFILLNVADEYGTATNGNYYCPTVFCEGYISWYATMVNFNQMRVTVFNFKGVNGRLYLSSDNDIGPSTNTYTVKLAKFNA